MKKTLKCQVCGLIFEATEIPDNCPKCGAPKEKLFELTGEAKDKIYKADRTNDIHAEIIVLASKIAKLCEEGIELKLDPPCVSVFEKSKDAAWLMKQLSKAEIAGHVGKEKW
jgi:rubredoxin